jgi:thiamine biosynthesis lipoprotein
MGTLVELGVGLSDGAEPGPPWAASALEAGWRAIAEVEAAASAFLPGSDVARFNAAPAGARIELRPDTAAVLRAAAALQARTAGVFDVSLGTAADGWALEAGGRVLTKRAGGARIDLGGIAKGHAVDRALAAIAGALRRSGQRRSVACWVNAGGDLAVRGLEVPVLLRDEEEGGARPWLLLRDGAAATSRFDATPDRLAGGPMRARHVSVVAPRCRDCDALTKVVGLTGRADHPAVRERGGRAWIHA